MQKRWLKTIVDEQQSAALQKELRVQPIVCELLVQRGIYTFEESKAFFRPGIEDLHDPFLMKDMEEAVARIEKAMEEGEKIMVYGDYDVDGTTSVSVVYSFFSELYDKLDYYIPDRYKEGYGVSKLGIDYAAEQGFSLMIALDCGIKAVELVDYAKEKGVDFIICDHHLPGEQIPNAVAVLDPKRNDCEYPYKELSGCGIGFKLIQAFAERNGIPGEVTHQYLDLVVISIASDIVPITGENRVLAYFGLDKLNKQPGKGVLALKEVSGLNGSATISDIVFMLGPRINAAGRLASAKAAVQVLIGSSKNELIDGVQELHARNQDRKELDKSITEEAMEMMLGEEMLQRKSTVVFSPDWHKGVIGIVASRLIEKHYRPTVVLTESEGKVTGSARSVKGFDLYAAISDCSDLLLQYGGHMHAAGLTMESSKVDAFVNRFEEVVCARITEEQLVPLVEIDAELSLYDVNYRLYNILKQFAPFGPGNMKPVFLSRHVEAKHARVVGENHLKLKLSQEKSPVIDAIAFGLAGKLNLVKGATFDLCYTIEENIWQGKKSLQLNVKDIKESGWS